MDEGMLVHGHIPCVSLPGSLMQYALDRETALSGYKHCQLLNLNRLNVVNWTDTVLGRVGLGI